MMYGVGLSLKCHPFVVIVGGNPKERYILIFQRFSAVFSCF